MPRILITLGDPAGIGPEIIDLALASDRLPAGFEFEILGERSAGTPGKPDARSAQSALDALHEAAERLKHHSADAVVTGPVSKQRLQALGFPFPGQTEFFADAMGVRDYGMLLTGASLCVGLATIHEPIAKVPALLTQERILRIGRLTAAFLTKRGVAVPRIAVAGLNPHAGEDGAFGDEEIRIIRPAIDQLNRLLPGVFSGPAVPDAIFRDAARGEFDAVIAMYHDQGLIPLKLLDFDTQPPFPRPPVRPPALSTAFTGKAIS